MSKIRIAFIKFGGLCIGGSERFLQVVAANLSRDLFDVDYYYCDAAPYLGSSGRHGDTNPDRLKYMQDNRVRLIKFNVQFHDRGSSGRPLSVGCYWEEKETKEQYNFFQDLLPF